MSEFDIITDAAEVAAIKSTPKRSNSRAKALREGHVVWLPGRTPTQTSGGLTTLFRGEGKRVVCRGAERDGVKGTYAWLVDMEPKP